ncbi:hypothetical protein BGZ90_008940, partial [Linnemannia elongata]
MMEVILKAGVHPFTAAYWTADSTGLITLLRTLTTCKERRMSWRRITITITGCQGCATTTRGTHIPTLDILHTHIVFPIHRRMDGQELKGVRLQVRSKIISNQGQCHQDTLPTLGIQSLDRLNTTITHIGLTKLNYRKILRLPRMNTIATTLAIITSIDQPRDRFVHWVNKNSLVVLLVRASPTTALMFRNSYRLHYHLIHCSTVPILVIRSQ